MIPHNNNSVTKRYSVDNLCISMDMAKTERKVDYNFT